MDCGEMDHGHSPTYWKVTSIKEWSSVCTNLYNQDCSLLLFAPRINVNSYSPTKMVGILTERLSVADGHLTGENSSYLRPSDPKLPIEELRKRYNEDGYLFLKQLLPREDVLSARQKYFQFLENTGILKDGTQPVEGIFNPLKSPEDFPGFGSGTPGKGEHAEDFVTRALDAHYQDWYTQDFCKHSVLLDFIAEFTGWGQNTLGMKRSLLRNNVPSSTPIGVHYDQIFLRYGDPTSVTAWVPMGDIKLSGGGLMYLEDGTVDTLLMNNGPIH